MRDLRTEAMQLAGCSLAEKLSFVNDWAGQEKMLKAGLLDVVLLAMPAFNDCADLQKHACAVLDNMAKVRWFFSFLSLSLSLSLCVTEKTDCVHLMMRVYV